MLRKTFVIACLMIFHREVIQAQDVSFSQYSLMPMYLNPAMTGFHNGLVRVGAIYRNQSMPIGGFGASYNTVGGFVDASLFKDKLKNDYFGIGASAFYDKNGVNTFKTTDASLNLAYSKGFGKEVKHSLAIGFGGEIQLNSLAIANAVYPDGINENTIPSNFLFDANVGVNYHIMFSQKVNAYIGFAYHHFLQPNNRWTASGKNKWLSKYIAHGGAQFYLNDKWDLAPTFLFAMQGTHIQAMVGALGTRKFSNRDESTTSISLGLNTRFGKKGVDAIIPQLKLDIKNFYISTAFDIQVSQLSKANNSYGAFEIAAGYIFIKNNIKRGSRTQCPIF